MYARIKPELDGMRVPTKDGFIPLAVCNNNVVFRAVQRDIDDDFDTWIRLSKGSEVYKVRSIDFDFYITRQQAEYGTGFADELLEGDEGNE